MRITVFDYRVLRTNPVGSWHRALLQALCHGHDFTVFAVQFDNPCPERINWVRVRVRVVPRRCCSWPTTWWHRSATCSSSDGEGIPTTWSRWSRATWRSATCRTSTSARARSCGRRRPGAGPCETGFAGSTIASTPWPSPWVFGRIRRIVVPGTGWPAGCSRSTRRPPPRWTSFPTRSTSTGCGGRRASTAGRYAPASASTTPTSSSPCSGTSGARPFPCSVDRTGVSMAAGLRRFGSLPESRRQQMATAARAAAQRYGLDAFVAGWAKLYAGLEA